MVNNSEHSSPEIELDEEETANKVSANVLPTTPLKKSPEDESNFLNTLDEIL